MQKKGKKLNSLFFHEYVRRDSKLEGRPLKILLNSIEIFYSLFRQTLKFCTFYKKCQPKKNLKRGREEIIFGDPQRRLVGDPRGPDSR